jgi:hypothetical protein
MSLRITVRIPGQRSQLGACRKLINAMLDEDRDIRYRELHSDDRLEYGLTNKTGVPFPPFVNASAEFPDLMFSFSWEGLDGESGGRATIENGRLVSQDAGVDKTSGQQDAVVHIAAANDGTIHLAVALQAVSDAYCTGYAVTAEQHGYFLWQRAADESRLIATHGMTDQWEREWILRDSVWTPTALAGDRAIPTATLATLEKITNEFAAEWLWFAAEDEVDTALERHRFSSYGLIVNPANLRSEKIRSLPRDTTRGIYFSTLQSPFESMVDALDRCWREGWS